MASIDVSDTKFTAVTTALPAQKKITYRELRPDIVLNLQKSVPDLNLDDEVPQILYNMLPPNTVGEWKQMGYTTDLYDPEEALEIFINDKEARYEGYIEISEGFRRYSSRGFSHIKEKWNHFYPGYTDEERRSINDETPMTYQLQYAILASTYRSPKN